MTAPSRPESSPRILIADADSVIRAQYAGACMAEGWDVVEAVDGRDALVRALAHPPSLALIDLRLPVIDGFGLCEILRKDRATAAVPIIALSNDEPPLDQQRALRGGPMRSFRRQRRKKRSLSKRTVCCRGPVKCGGGQKRHH